MRLLVKDGDLINFGTSKWTLLLMYSDRCKKLKESFPEINVENMNYIGEMLLTKAITFYYNNGNDYYSWIHKSEYSNIPQTNCNNYNKGYWRKEIDTKLITRLLINKYMNYSINVFNRRLVYFINNPTVINAFHNKLLDFLDTTGLTIEHIK